MTATYDLSRKFIYRNARPLDLAIWRYHFEGGGKEQALEALGAYQNDDGGFGHGLEPDCADPHSSPIQVWKATEILREIDWRDAGHPAVSGILRYLGGGAGTDPESGLWRGAIPSYDDHPHAVWWSYREKGDAMSLYNPTAALAGFLIRYADKNSALYAKGLDLAHGAYDWLAANVPFEEMHTTGCFIALYEYLADSSAAAEFDMARFRSILREQIGINICRDVSKWGKEYVALPSELIRSKNGVGYEDNQELIKKECELLLRTQEPDGGRAVTFRWGTEYKEQEIAYLWWKSYLVIKTELYLREFL